MQHAIVVHHKTSRYITACSMTLLCIVVNCITSTCMTHLNLWRMTSQRNPLHGTVSPDRNTPFATPTRTALHCNMQTPCNTLYGPYHYLTLLYTAVHFIALYYPTLPDITLQYLTLHDITSPYHISHHITLPTLSLA